MYVRPLAWSPLRKRHLQRATESVDGLDRFPIRAISHRNQGDVQQLICPSCSLSHCDPEPIQDSSSPILCRSVDSQFRWAISLQLFAAQAANRASISSIPEASFVPQAGDRKRQRQRHREIEKRREESQKERRVESTQGPCPQLCLSIIPRSLLFPPAGRSQSGLLASSVFGPAWSSCPRRPQLTAVCFGFS